MLYEEINVAVDSGKGFTKFLVKDTVTKEYKTSAFPTKIERVSNLGYDLTANSYQVEYNGESYLVGEMLNNLVNTDLTKKTQEHLLCIFLSVVNAIKLSNCKKVGIYRVNLALNTPLTIFKNKKLKEEYEEFIRQGGDTIHFVVNDEHFLFKIQNLYLLQEGIGSLLLRSDLKSRNSVQIDIGTLNVSVNSFSSLIPHLDSTFSNSYGINTLFSTLRERLAMDYGVTVHYKDLERIINDRILVVEGKKMLDSTTIIEETIENHAKQIIASVKAQVSLNNTEISFVGGGSILLFEQLKKLVPHATFEPDPQFCSLNSFYRIMEAKLHAQRL